jgi:tetratricopeptide (TPR) repeat protein
VVFSKTLQTASKPYQEYQKKLQRYEQALGEAIQHEHSLSNETCNEFKRLQQVLKLRDEDITQIEAQVSAENKPSQLAGKTADAIQTQILSRSGNLALIKPSIDAGAASLAETPMPPRTGRPRMLAISVPVLKNPKLLLGTGIATAVAVTLIFLLKTPQLLHNAEPSPNNSPTVYSAPQTSAQDLFERAKDKDNKKDYKGAIEDYNQAIRLKPDYDDAYFYRGLVKYSLRDYQGAIADSNQALKLSPKDSVYYYARGNAKSALEDYKGAIADYNQALKFKPNYDNAYYGRGEALSNSGDNQGAIADYRKAAQLYQKQGKTKYYQDTLEQIKKLQ